MKFSFLFGWGIAATMLAAQSIQLGINDVVVAGGMESMSNAPKYLAEARLIRLSHSWFSSFCIQVVISDSVLACRKGSRLGHDTLVDGMMKDGLWDVYNDCGMGSCAELCAEKHVITREDQVLCSLRGSFDETNFLAGLGIWTYIFIISAG